MKRISHQQSRWNSAQRRRKLVARHAKAGRWSPQAAPMLSPGKAHYEIGSNTDAMIYGGIGAVHRLVAKLGLAEKIDESLKLLKVHLPYHESDHVLNIAYNVLCGGTRLEDIERLRHSTAYMNALGAELIPDPTTAGDFCRHFPEDDVIQLMESINAVRPQLWRGRARELLGPVTYIDADGTSAPTCGAKKAGMDISYKGVCGYAPLIVSLANTKGVLYVVNRPGNVPSHTGAASLIDRAIDQVAPYTERVCLRGDTAFSLTAHFDRWAESVDFIFGMDASAALCRRAHALAEGSWQRLERKARYQTLTNKRWHRFQEDEKERIEREYPNLKLNHEDVAKFEYQPGKCKRPYRVVVVRKNISKNGVNALRMPLYDLVSNGAYMVIAALAWNLKSWFAMMMHRKRDRAEYIAMEFRRFLHIMILIPCRVVRRARGTTLRMLGYQPTLDRFFSTWLAIERTGFA